MVFKRKFFLDLSGAGEKKPVQVAPPQAAPAKAPVAPAPATTPAPTAAPSAGEAAATAGEAAAPVPGATPAPPSSSSGQGPVLTTAEAIAAELAAQQASRPPASAATFAPECVTAGGALPRARRRPAADLGSFREIARGMMGG